MKWVIAGILAVSAAAAAANGYMTFSYDGGETPRGGSYTTRGGCTAYRAPEVEHRVVQGAASLRFLESAYIHQVAKNIEAAGGKCTCELRFPTWDAALEDLEKRFTPLPDDESSAWVRDFANSDLNRLTLDVNKVCKAQGIY